MFKEIFLKLGVEYADVESCIKEGRLVDAFYLVDKKPGINALFLKSFILILLNKYDKALDILKEIKKEEVEVVPIDVFYEVYGLCYYYSKNYLEASKYFILSLDLNENNFYSRYNLANIYLINKDYKKSLKAFEKALEFEPHNQKIKENIDKINKIIENI